MVFPVWFSERLPETALRSNNDRKMGKKVADYISELPLWTCPRHSIVLVTILLLDSYTYTDFLFQLKI